jgi:ribonuclease P protein component
MPSHTLPPARRLRRRGEFQRVFDTGRRAHGRYFTIVAAPGAGPSPRLGIVASRKIGGAVVRNRAKRLIREAFRTLPDLVGAGVDVVVIAKPPLAEAGIESVRTDYRAVVRRYLSKT